MLGEEHSGFRVDRRAEDDMFVVSNILRGKERIEVDYIQQGLLTYIVEKNIRKRGQRNVGQSLRRDWIELKR